MASLTLPSTFTSEDSMLSHHSGNASIHVFISAQQPIITDDVRDLIQTILNALILTFGCLGVATNAINIRVFIQQGVWSDSSTIGLFSLAIADFLGCLLLIPGGVCSIVKYTASSVHGFMCETWFMLIFPLPHIAMARLSCWINVYIAVERSLCVLLPFKVKILIRPRVTFVSMAFMYVASFFLYFPMYVNTGVKWVHHSAFNASVATYTETVSAKTIRNYMSVIFNTVMSNVAFAIVAVATGLMLYKLNQMNQWRQKKAFAGKELAFNEDKLDKKHQWRHKKAFAGKELASNEDIKLDKKHTEAGNGRKDVEMLKMVLMVTLIFLVCLSMSHLPGFASAFIPEFSVTGLNKNAFYLSYWYKFVFDLINSSLNFFFFVRISSRYRTAFNEVFHKVKNKV